MFMPNLGSFFTPPDPDPDQWPKNIPDPKHCSYLCRTLRGGGVHGHVVHRRILVDGGGGHIRRFLRLVTGV